jgi:hypothetical protein
MSTFGDTPIRMLAISPSALHTAEPYVRVCTRARSCEYVKTIVPGDISDSQGDSFEDNSLLGHSAV